MTDCVKSYLGHVRALSFAMLCLAVGLTSMVNTFLEKDQKNNDYYFDMTGLFLAGFLLLAMCGPHCSAASDASDIKDSLLTLAQSFSGSLLVFNLFNGLALVTCTDKRAHITQLQWSLGLGAVGGCGAAVSTGVKYWRRHDSTEQQLLRPGYAQV